MREPLEPLVGRRLRFRGTVDRVGWSGSGELYLLLKGVTREDTGETIDDHLWVWMNGRLWASRPSPGERISFSACVEQYVRKDGTEDLGLRRVREVRSQTKRNRKRR